MRAVLQRVREAWVHTEGREVARIGPGLLVLLGIGKNDDQQAARYLVEKIAGLRIFPGAGGDMDAPLSSLNQGAVLVVSQFTLFGDCRKGRRPSFSNAAVPHRALELYEKFLELMGQHTPRVASGCFRAMMDVGLVNWGPVTILLDSRREF